MTCRKVWRQRISGQVRHAKEPVPDSGGNGSQWRVSSRWVAALVQAARAKIPWTGWLKHTFLSLNSGGWEVGDQSTARSGVWWEPASFFADCLLIVPSPRARKQALSHLFSCLGTLILSWCLHPQDLVLSQGLKAPSPDSITVGMRVSTHEFGGDTNIQSRAVTWLVVFWSWSPWHAGRMQLRRRQDWTESGDCGQSAEIWPESKKGSCRVGCWGGETGG